MLLKPWKRTKVVVLVNNLKGNNKKNPHFKKSDIYDLIDQHSIIGLNWKYVADYGKINMNGTEITSDYIVNEIKDKLNNNKPLT